MALPVSLKLFELSHDLANESSGGSRLHIRSVGGHPDPEIRGDPVSKKNFVGPSGLSMV